MKNLYLEVQGVKGGKPKTTEKNASVWAQFGNNVINIDNFQGRGDAYKQRKEPEILIMTTGKDGKTFFEGTFKELFNKLKS